MAILLWAILLKAENILPGAGPFRRTVLFKAVEVLRYLVSDLFGLVYATRQNLDQLQTHISLRYNSGPNHVISHTLN